jgi:hypothetical protein
MMMVPTLFFRFGTDDAEGTTKISLKDAANILGDDLFDQVDVQVQVHGRVNTPYTEVPVVGSNQYCYIIDLSDLGIPLGSNCIMMKTAVGRYSILCT